MDRNYALEGRLAAKKRRYLGWVFAGLFLPPPISLALPMLQRRLAVPEPPVRVLREGPTEAVAQQVFLAEYVRRAHARRRRKAWLGFVVSFWWFCTPSFVGPLFEGAGDRQPGVGTQQRVERNVGAPAGREELRGTAAAVEAERRHAEEVRDAEVELRERLSARIEEIEELYDTIAATHEEVARVLVDQWEQRSARDRATLAQVAKRHTLKNIQATREFQGLERAVFVADFEYRKAQQELAQARERLAQAAAAQ